MKRALWGALAAALLYILSSRAYYVGFFNDDAFYLIGARSLLHGRYVELNDPSRPPLLNYPPGYPLLLAPLVAVAGEHWWAYQLFSVALNLSALGAWLFAFEEELEPEVAWPALWAFACCPLILSLSGAVLSEIPYLLLTLGVLAAASRSWADQRLSRWAAIGALSGFCVLTRTAGVALAAALGLCLAAEGRRRQAVAALTAAAAVAAPYWLRNLTLSGHGELRFFEFWEPYLRSGGAWAAARGAAAAALYYCRELFANQLFRAPRGGALLMAAAVAATGAGVRSWALVGWRKLPVAYASIYILVILLWAMRAPRYLHPILPLAAAFAFLGVDEALRSYGLKKGQGARVACALSLALSAAPACRIVRASMFERTRVTAPPARSLSWIAAHTNADDLFASELDGRLFLLSGRPAVRVKRGLSGAAYAFVEPGAPIMRTASGRLSNDPLPDTELSALLGNLTRWRRVFEDSREGTMIFRAGD